MLELSSGSFADEREDGPKTSKHAVQETFLTGRVVDVAGRAGWRGRRGVEDGWGGQVTDRGGAVDQGRWCRVSR